VSASASARISEGPIAPAIQDVFEALERAAVRWCLLRGETDLAPTAHDLDLLVSPDQVPTLAAAVRPLGFAPVPTPARGSHQFFVSYVCELDRWLILDVVTELSFGPGYLLRTRAAAGCLARRETVGSLVVPSADDGFWVLLLHRLLDRESFRASDRERLQRLVAAARTDGALARFAAALCPAGWDPAAIVAAVRRNEWGALSGLGGQLRADWRRKHLARLMVRRLVAAVARIGSRVSGRARPGLRVALVADEVATARQLAAALARSFYLPVTPLASVEPSRLGGTGRLATRHLRTSAARCVVARLHQLRGRLVALPVCAPLSESTDAAVRAAAPGFRAHLVFDIRQHSGNGSARERELTADLWQAYCERRD
jgi:hypothetical protein